MERTGDCPDGIVYIVDDDDLVRRSLECALGLEGLKTEAFSKAGDFLKCAKEDGVGCLVTDVRMPEMDGLELQEEIIRRDLALSVIVVTGHADVPLAVRATRAGALDILEKPFKTGRLVTLVKTGLEKSAQKAKEKERRRIVTGCFNSLSDRERDVLKQIVAGNSNKVIAFELNISPKTVEVHRASIMRKMNVRSIAALVQQSALVL